MRDRIHINGLILPTVIGVPEEERGLPQSVLINATIILANSFSDAGDDLSRTVDYFEVTQMLRKEAANGERKLIETLAEDLARVILRFAGVYSVILEVRKFILPNCGYVSVEITRDKQ
jgi:FolB domain-containing protein